MLEPSSAFVQNRPMPKLKLYFFPGTCARVSLIALEECGAQFDTQLVKLMTGEHRSPEYLAINPLGKVPTLLVDGQPLTETLAIIGYLQRSFPGTHLMPESADAFTEARHYSTLAWLSSTVQPLVTRILLPQLLCDLPEGAGRVYTQGTDAMRWQLRTVEALLEMQPWLLGSQWSVADAFLFWIFDQITQADFPAREFPNINAHSARSIERPAIQRAVEHEKRAGMEMAKLGLPAGPPSRPGKKS
jgi:glutathione S-transferase